MNTKTVGSFTASEIAAMPKTARPIGCKTLSEQDFRNKYADRVRHGKTAKDRKRQP